MQEEQEIRAELLEQSSVFPNRIVQFEQAKKAPRESESKWLLLKNPFDVVLNLDRDGTILFINPTLPGYTIEDIIGITVYDFIPPKQHKKTRKAIKEVFKTGEVVSFKTRVFGPDGSLLRYSTHLSPVKNCDKVVCVAQVFTKITERKKTENKLQESEKQVRSLIQNAPNIILHLSPDHRILEFNPAAEQFFGRKRDDVLGQNYLELFVPEQHRDAVAADIKKVLAGELTRNYENPLIAHDGSKHLFMWNVNRLLDSNDKPSGIIAIGQDITERKEMENRQTLRFEISKTFHQQQPLKYICQKVVFLIQECLDYEVVALRMKENDDYPYFVNTSFSQKFIKTENYLCIHDEKGDCLRDSRGHVVLACMCGIVINAKFNQDKPFFTKEGSFWTNSTSDLLASTSVDDRGGTTRNACNQNGYESVALIPIKVNDENIGLLQINDKRRNLFSSRGIQFLEELGHIIGMSVEHTKAEEALVESETRYRKYIDNAPDGVFVVDANGKYIEVNEAACRMAGYSSEELLNMSIPELLAPTSIKVGFNGFKQLKCKGTLSDVLLLRHRDGTEFCVALDAVKLSDNRFMAYCKDITARKKAEEEIRKLSYAIDQSIDGVSIGDLEPKMLYVNNAFARMHGYTSEDMIGMPVEKLLKKEYVCEFKSRINQIQTQGVWEGEIDHIRKDRTVFPIYMSITLLKNNEGKPIGMLAIARDITESKQKEKELNIYREKMARNEQLASLGTLSATVAHELTQPLTVIRLSIQNSLAELKTVMCPDSVVEDLKEGLKEISNIISIVDRFRNFARISSEKTAKIVDLREIAERIVELLDENAWRSKVTLQVKDMDILPPICSYQKELERLYFSLVENSIQAADGKKSRHVIISSVIRDGHVELQFSDNCGGISPKNLKRIFEPFFTTKDASGRTGLGLCIVERIVSKLNGKIRVESKLGKGSTFFVILPIKGE